MTYKLEKRLFWGMTGDRDTVRQQINWNGGFVEANHVPLRTPWHHRPAHTSMLPTFYLESVILFYGNISTVNTSASVPK